MRASTATRLLGGILGFMLLALALMSLSGNEEARSLLPQFLVLTISVAGIAYLSYRFKVAPRRAVFTDEATRLGLSAAPGDPSGFLSSRFEVARRRASVRDAENTAVGPWHGQDVTVVDYWYATSSDPTLDDYERFVCATFPVPPAWPRTLVVPERLATLLGGAIFGSDPGTESEEFNRRYAVRADDRRFASAILDARMIGWILSLPSNTGFEILDGWLLCFVARRELGDVEHALSTGERFLAQVPDAARSIFG